MGDFLDSQNLLRGGRASVKNIIKHFNFFLIAEF